MKTSSTDADTTRVPLRGGPAQVDSHGATSQQGAPFGATVNNTHKEESRLLPWLMLTCILSGAALMGSLWSVSESRRTERETRLLQLKADDMRVALLSRGINPSPHHDGESP